MKIRFAPRVLFIGLFFLTLRTIKAEIITPPLTECGRTPAGCSGYCPYDAIGRQQKCISKLTYDCGCVYKNCSEASAPQCGGYCENHGTCRAVSEGNPSMGCSCVGTQCNSSLAPSCGGGSCPNDQVCAPSPFQKGDCACLNPNCLAVSVPWGAHVGDACPGSCGLNGHRCVVAEDPNAVNRALICTCECGTEGRYCNNLCEKCNEDNGKCEFRKSHGIQYECNSDTGSEEPPPCPNGMGTCKDCLCTCIRDSDCPADFRCVNGSCVKSAPGGPCAIDPDCPKGYYCVFGTCSKPTPGDRCQVNYQCPNCYLCFSIDGIQPSACNPSPYVQCVPGSNCPGGQPCDSSCSCPCNDFGTDEGGSCGGYCDELATLCLPNPTQGGKCSCLKQDEICRMRIAEDGTETCKGLCSSNKSNCVMRSQPDGSHLCGCADARNCHLDNRGIHPTCGGNCPAGQACKNNNPISGLPDCGCVDKTPSSNSSSLMCLPTDKMVQNNPSLTGRATLAKREKRRARHISRVKH